MCIMESKGWTREGYAPPQPVPSKLPDDEVQATFNPSKGCGWQIFDQGKQSVGFRGFFVVVSSVQCVLESNLMTYCRSSTAYNYLI